jgi:hypothetical protein
MPRMETSAYLLLARLEIATGDYRPALDLLRDTAMWHSDAGDFFSLTASLALISALLMRCDLPEPAAIIAGFATTPFTLAAYPQFAAAVEQLPHTRSWSIRRVIRLSSDWWQPLASDVLLTPRH